MENFGLEVGQEVTLDEIFEELGCEWGMISFEDLLENRSIDNYDGEFGVNVIFSVLQINESEDWKTKVEITEIHSI
jgi:hypothetical protein